MPIIQTSSFSNSFFLFRLPTKNVASSFVHAFLPPRLANCWLGDVIR